MLGVSVESAAESSSSMEDLELVADDLIAAVKSGNAPMVARALRTAHLICSNYEGGGAGEGSRGPGRSFDKYMPIKKL